LRFLFFGSRSPTLASGARGSSLLQTLELQRVGTLHQGLYRLYIFNARADSPQTFQQRLVSCRGREVAGLLLIARLREPTRALAPLGVERQYVGGVLHRPKATLLEAAAVLEHPSVNGRVEVVGAARRVGDAAPAAGRVPRRAAACLVCGRADIPRRVLVTMRQDSCVLRPQALAQQRHRRPEFVQGVLVLVLAPDGGLDADFVQHSRNQQRLVC
jgi:hypothetical protein